MRLFAARALGQIGAAAKPVLPELRRLAEDRTVDRQANKIAREAIEKIK
jgi:hypothetical protein